ncbi:MAG: 1,4-alpha-glucan branching protein GlgB [Hyphomicrobiaceae bacterium]|nr:1,4-alpha-glucan branching protein GlgB [Hyphomicrobiaceae bacterium]
MAGWQLGSEDLKALEAGAHDNPFSVLGLHEKAEGVAARLFLVHAEFVDAIDADGNVLAEMKRISDTGIFEGLLPAGTQGPQAYRARNSGGDWVYYDPYSFGPVLGPMDDYYMGEGSHLRLFDKLGSHVMQFEGVDGVHFAVWAPNARRVSVVGPFNDWDGRRHAMRKRMDTGIWEIFVPGLDKYEIYKFEIIGAQGTLLPLKSDPMGQQAEMRPKTASIVPNPDPFEWTDEAYMAKRSQADWRRKPMSIYEVHLGSWRRRPDGTFLSYDQLAEQLVPYAKDMGFTHLELLPISEHPFDPSWGYQPVGLYAPTSRFGDPHGFARFVNAAHKEGLGIILDWVPAHFPTDEHGLARFDGTALYEHLDPRRGFHPDWNTLIYNFSRREVLSFLVNNALYWLEKFHIDGLRVDAVASMLYLDYSRQPGQWIPNSRGGNENDEAIAFLKRFNEEVYRAQSGIFTIAEESTSFGGVSKPTNVGGLGFGFKWNMGFMNDTLRYMSRDPIYRRYHHNDMTFGLLYAYSENFVLPLSHDEVVHGKGSLLSKMSGDNWQQFANLRAYYGFMWGYPGKKLLFMGQEFAQRDEWSEARGLDWRLLDADMHDKMRALVADLNAVYREMGALHQRDCEPEGFEWLIANDYTNSVFAWVRRAPDQEPVVVVTNFTPQTLTGYVVPMPQAGRWVERLNTDSDLYGGSNQGNLGGVEAAATGHGGWPAEASLTIPPLATLILRPDN